MSVLQQARSRLYEALDARALARLRARQEVDRQFAPIIDRRSAELERAAKEAAE